MSAHTPGRLLAGVCIYEDGSKHFCAVQEGNEKKIVALSGLAGEANEQEAMSNSSRLAVCWNACEGIPTSELEGKSIDEYVSQQAFITGMNPNPEGMDLGVKGLAAQMMAASFAGQFIGNGAVNYLELSMSHPDVGPFTVTIQRTQGLTPTQKLKQVEDQRDVLLEALRSVFLWMENQADSQSKGGHATFDLMLLREQRDIAQAAIAKAEGGA